MKSHFYDSFLVQTFLFRTTSPSISELCLIAYQKLLGIFEMSPDQSPCTDLAGQWRSVSPQPREGEVYPGGRYWSSLCFCLSAQTPNSFSIPTFHFFPRLWFSGSCIEITTGISPCEPWLWTHSLSQFLHSSLCCRPHLMAAPTTDPTRPGLHFCQAPWGRTGILSVSFFWDII